MPVKPSQLRPFSALCPVEIPCSGRGKKRQNIKISRKSEHISYAADRSVCSL